MADHYAEYRRTADKASVKQLGECLNPSLKVSPHPYDETPKPKRINCERR